jgi:hypothetical protein
MLSKKDLRHVFSIEMKSMEYVSNISISERTHGHVVFEGDLGKLESLNLVEDNVLELLGTNGAIRLTVSEQKLQNLLTVRAKSDKKNKECARACV